MQPRKDLPLKVLAILLALAGCTRAGSDRYGPPVAPATPATSTPAATTGAEPHDGAEPGTDNHELLARPSADEAVRVAQAFANAWVDTAGGGDAWRNGLQAWSEPGLTRALDTADPGYVSARHVTGPPTLTPAEDQQWLRADIPTDTGTLLLTLAPIDGRWLVSDVDFHRSTS